jgi:hypothetical protein
VANHNTFTHSPYLPDDEVRAMKSRTLWLGDDDRLLDTLTWKQYRTLAKIRNALAAGDLIRAIPDDVKRYAELKSMREANAMLPMLKSKVGTRGVWLFSEDIQRERERYWKRCDANRDIAQRREAEKRRKREAEERRQQANGSTSGGTSGSTSRATNTNSNIKERNRTLERHP